MARGQPVATIMNKKPKKANPRTTREYMVRLVVCFAGSAVVEAASKREAKRIARRILEDGNDGPQRGGVIKSINFDTRVKNAGFGVVDVSGI